MARLQRAGSFFSLGQLCRNLAQATKHAQGPSGAVMLKAMVRLVRMDFIVFFFPFSNPHDMVTHCDHHIPVEGANQLIVLQPRVMAVAQPKFPKGAAW
jgi:hypothetical protein